MFNKKATWWLGMWLDSGLNFIVHINEKLKKTKMAEVKIKELSKFMDHLQLL